MSEYSFPEVEYNNPVTVEKILLWHARIVMGFLIGTLLLVVLSITALFLNVFGFHIGTHSIPAISKVDLPDSRYHVVLYGPHSGEPYFYGIFAEQPFQRYGTYSLGPARVDEAAEPKVQKQAPEVYRIDWGTGPNAAYAILDLKHGRILEDANPATKRNMLFKIDKK